MPSPTENAAIPACDAPRAADAPRRAPVVGPATSAATMLAEARRREVAGRLSEAMEHYEATVRAAAHDGDCAVMSEALRRLAAVHHKSGDAGGARALCHRSYVAAKAMPNDVLAAEALNTLGVVEMMSGALAEARDVFQRALRLGGAASSLRARVDQNLGILANIQGRLDEARGWYVRSLGEFRRVGDEHGCAIAYHNLAMVSTDAGRYAEAERNLSASHAIAQRGGDRFLQALCLVNGAEVDFARQRYENARQNAEDALSLFEALGAQAAKADAYRILGMVFRETGNTVMAESRLLSAITLAVSVGSVLSEAEAHRELALVYQATGRSQKALRCLHEAYRLFRRLDAQAELVYVGGKMAELEATYRAVVRAWGRSIESSDGYTFGHCERVARTAVAIARAMGLDEHEETTILIGAYLHDVGMVRVPHEILRKSGELAEHERRLLEMHPVWGVELLANVEFPWDIKGIIRWHHEHRDGSGYPDRLEGDAIPVTAQIVGLANFYDELTSARALRPARSAAEALAEIRLRAAWWSSKVVAAFERAVAPASPP